MLAGIWRRAGVGIRYGVVNLSPDDLDRDRQQVWLAETLVVLEPVGVRDDSVRLVKVGQQIQRSGSAVPVGRIVEHLEERVVDSVENFLAQRAVRVSKGVKGERRRVVGVPDGRCSGAGRAGRDDV